MTLILTIQFRLADWEMGALHYSSARMVLCLSRELFKNESGALMLLAFYEICIFEAIKRAVPLGDYELCGITMEFVSATLITLVSSSAFEVL